MNKRTKEIEPSILYYGMPVILLSTQNEDGSVNLSPLSSSWALGDCVVIGVSTEGKAFENIERQNQCVINVPDPSLWRNVEELAAFTGKDPVPEAKKRLGYTYCKEKFAYQRFDAVSVSIRQTGQSCRLPDSNRSRGQNGPHSRTYAVLCRG